MRQPARAPDTEEAAKQTRGHPPSPLSPTWIERQLGRSYVRVAQLTVDCEQSDWSTCLIYLSQVRRQFMLELRPWADGTPRLGPCQTQRSRIPAYGASQRQTGIFDAGDGWVCLHQRRRTGW